MHELVNAAAYIALGFLVGTLIAKLAIYAYDLWNYMPSLEWIDRFNQVNEVIAQIPDDPTSSDLCQVYAVHGELLRITNVKNKGEWDGLCLACRTEKSKWITMLVKNPSLIENDPMMDRLSYINQSIKTLCSNPSAGDALLDGYQTRMSRWISDGLAAGMDKFGRG